MTAEQFAYWLQGCVELNPAMEQPSPEQWNSIKEHLTTVFVKVTPPLTVQKTETMEEALRRYREASQFNNPHFGMQPNITC